MEDLRSNVHGWKISPPVVGWGWLQKELNPQVHNIKKTVSIHWIMKKIIIIVIIIILMWFHWQLQPTAAREASPQLKSLNLTPWLSTFLFWWVKL